LKRQLARAEQCHAMAKTENEALETENEELKRQFAKVQIRKTYYKEKTIEFSDGLEALDSKYEDKKSVICRLHKEINDWKTKFTKNAAECTLILSRISKVTPSSS